MFRAPAPHPDSGLCFKCGRPGHRSRECPQNQNQLALPSAGHGNGCGNSQPRNNNARPSYGRGQAYHVELNETQGQPASVKGTLLVNLVPASVLFDSKVSHSFISEAFAYMHGIKYGELKRSSRSRLLRGTARRTSRNTPIFFLLPLEFLGREFLLEENCNTLG